MEETVHDIEVLASDFFFTLMTRLGKEFLIVFWAIDIAFMGMEGFIWHWMVTFMANKTFLVIRLIQCGKDLKFDWLVTSCTDCSKVGIVTIVANVFVVLDVEDIVPNGAITDGTKETVGVVRLTIPHNTRANNCLITMGTDKTFGFVIIFFTKELAVAFKEPTREDLATD